MNRSNAVGAALLVVGLLLGGLIVERAGAQARTTKIRTWPPEPHDIVNLRGESQGLDDGDSVVVFTVPNDRWLILNDVRICGYGQLVGGYAAGVSANMFALVEDSSGLITTKLDGAWPSSAWSGGLPADTTAYYLGGEGVAPISSVVGYAFRPGSQVRVRYANAVDIKGDAVHAIATWNLIGYLTDR